METSKNALDLIREIVAASTPVTATESNGKIDAMIVQLDRIETLLTKLLEAQDLDRHQKQA